MTALSRITSASGEAVQTALTALAASLADRGITLLEKDGAYMLGTHPDASSLIEKLLTEELNRDLGRAGLETLTTILYRCPLTRTEIDYIRGVNSAFIVRNLLVRGLVERVPNPNRERSFLYRPTFDLLSFLGVSRIEDLPDYITIRAHIEQFEHETPESAVNDEHINS